MRYKSVPWKTTIIYTDRMLSQLLMEWNQKGILPDAYENALQIQKEKN